MAVKAAESLLSSASWVAATEDILSYGVLNSSLLAEAKVAGFLHNDSGGLIGWRHTHNFS